MIIQRKKTLPDEKSHLHIKSNYVFEGSDIDKYKQSFEDLRIQGILKASSFEENQWLIQFNKSHFNKLNFNLDIFPKLNVSLKCFIIVQINSGRKGPTCLRTLRVIKEATFLTNGFLLDNIDYLEERLESIGYSIRDIMARQVIYFLSFINHYNLTEFTDLCEKYTNRFRKNRDLPNFKHVLQFDDFIHSYFSSCTKQEKNKFFPILLWWRITTIIPLRPEEFLQLKKNCLIKDKNTFWIILPRNKLNRYEPRDLEITDTIAISEEIYNFIQEYLQIVTSSTWRNSDYLFPYEATSNFLERSNVAKILKRDHSRVEYHQFYNLLEQFYSENMEEKSDLSIDKLKPGDTRHFAFCNMMLQGFNALTIARIGGHKQIRQQEHYWSHIEYFTQSWVYNLTEKYRRFYSIDKSIREADFSHHELLTKSNLWGDQINLNELIKVDYGYCTDKEFPNNCGGDCRFCESYYFMPQDEDYNEAIEWLLDRSDLLEQKISEQIKFMKYISNTIMYDEETLKASPLGNEQLKSTSAELFRMIEQKARVDSHLPKEINMEEENEQ